jgi:flagellar assembly protein FliH
MTARLDLTAASVLPYQFPSLKAGGAEPGVATAAPQDAQDDFGAHAAMPEANGAEGSAGEIEHGASMIAEELSKAHAEGLRSGFEEGREKGYAAGLAEGAAAGAASIKDQVERLAAIVARLSTPIAALEPPLEEAIAGLALEVARCVIGAEVKRSREFLVRLIREAVAQVPLEMGTPRVLLNPADLELVRQLAPEIEPAGAALIGDETIDAGGCLVIADGDRPIKDRRWNPRAAEGVSQVDLTLSARWRNVMLTLFEGEDA